MPPKKVIPEQVVEIPETTTARPLHVRIVGHAAKLIETLRQVMFVLMFLSPVFWWAWGTLEAKAQEAFEASVKEIIAPLLAEQKAVTDGIAATLNTIVETQGAESTQSEGEAESTEQILRDNQEMKCMLQKLTDAPLAPECL